MLSSLISFFFLLKKKIITTVTIGLYGLRIVRFDWNKVTFIIMIFKKRNVLSKTFYQKKWIKVWHKIHWNIDKNLF